MARTDDVEMLRYTSARLGWTETVRSRGGFTLHAPNDPARIVLPAKGPLRQSIRVSWTRKIVRYADPVKRAAFLGEHADLIEGTGMDWRDFGIAPVPDSPPKRTKSKEPTALEALEQTVPEHEPEPVREPEHEPVFTPSFAETGEHGTVVGIGPWFAGKRHGKRTTGGGYRYQSEAVKERRWSDGFVDYVCALDGCDYVNESPRSVARHYGTRTDHPAVGPEIVVLRDPEYLEPKGHRALSESERIGRWKRRLEKAMVGLDPTAEDFTEQLAERMAEQSEGTGSDGSSEPMTPEQVLEKIRRLVDGGVYLATQQRMGELEAQLLQVETDLEQARRTAVEADARAVRFRDRWTTLVEIVKDEED